MNLQDTLSSVATMGASWVMWLLVALSILGLAIAVERAIVMFTTRDDIRRLKDDVTASLRGLP